MPLLSCPDCNKDVSDSAPSCPHCGRPMKNDPATTGVICYSESCDVPATTKCQRCNKTSCVHHVDSITVNLAGNMMRTLCKDCQEAAKRDKAFTGVLIFFGVIILFILAVALNQVAPSP